ncbi:MAG: hypothetical protein OXJ52_09015 [Oligoflexia bacterium]|nr:hypothetical protein [Oligoflexia bacterium]
MKYNILILSIFLFLTAFLSEKTGALSLKKSLSSTSAGFHFDNCCFFSNIQFLDSFSKIKCRLQLQKKVCQNIDSQYKKKCGGEKDTGVLDIVKYLEGCLEGVMDTTFSMLTFLWTMMKGTYFLTFKEDTKLSKELSAFVQSSKNYLHIQYEQAYKESSPPNKILKAAGKTGDSIFSFFYNSAEGIIEDNFEEYQCLNQAKKTEMMCYFISGVLIPPITIFTLLKHGAKGAEKIYPAIKSAKEKFVSQNRQALYPKLHLPDKVKSLAEPNNAILLMEKVSSKQTKRYIKNKSKDFVNENTKDKTQEPL